MGICISGDLCPGTIRFRSESQFRVALVRSDLLAPVDLALSQKAFFGTPGPFLKPPEDGDELGPRRLHLAICLERRFFQLVVGAVAVPALLLLDGVQPLFDVNRGQWFTPKF